MTRTTRTDGTTVAYGKRDKNGCEDRLNGQEQTTLAPNENRQYVFDRIIRHLEIPTRTLYVVRWYRYTKNEDITEPSENIPLHHLDAYLRRMYKPQPILTSKRKLSRQQ